MAASTLIEMNEVPFLLRVGAKVEGTSRTAAFTTKAVYERTIDGYQLYEDLRVMSTFLSLAAC